LDTESGFPHVVLINSSYGLGESVVKGRVDPDEFLAFKPTLKQGFHPVLKRAVGAKQEKLIYATRGGRSTRTVPVPTDHYWLDRPVRMEVQGVCPGDMMRNRRIVDMPRPFGFASSATGKVQ
jgi:phosphoenolpyruvate synthase/pyruvate phosphate dikinase